MKNATCFLSMDHLPLILAYILFNLVFMPFCFVFMPFNSALMPFGFCDIWFFFHATCFNAIEAPISFWLAWHSSFRTFSLDSKISWLLCLYPWLRSKPDSILYHDPFGLDNPSSIYLTPVLSLKILNGSFNGLWSATYVVVHPFICSNPKFCWFWGTLTYRTFPPSLCLEGTLVGMKNITCFSSMDLKIAKDFRSGS